MIKEDIRRVLDRMQVQYRETKVGFECIHAPSIDLTSVQSGQLGRQLSNSRRGHQSRGGGAEGAGTGVRRSLKKKASKLGFGLKGKDKDKERERNHNRDRDVGISTSTSTGTGTTAVATQEQRSEWDKERDNATVNSAATEMSRGPSTSMHSNSSSLYNVSSNSHTIRGDAAPPSAGLAATMNGAEPPSSAKIGRAHV